MAWHQCLQSRACCQPCRIGRQRHKPTSVDSDCKPTSAGVRAEQGGRWRRIFKLLRLDQLFDLDLYQLRHSHSLRVSHSSRLTQSIRLS